MTLAELFMAQLTDPFRIGITVALMLTMFRTRANTGTWLPLAMAIGLLVVLGLLYLSMRRHLKRINFDERDVPRH